MRKKLMKPDRNSCDPALLSRFLDQELGPDDRARIDKHLKHCPACRRVLRGDQSISALFKTGLKEELSHAEFEESEERVFDLIRSKGIPWWMKVTDLFRSKRFYVPAAAMATVLILVFSVVKRPASKSGPSAIVSSFKGDVASVMILETRKSQQTILWFNESPDFRR
jgi:anti-sigma factor RsiW